MPLKSLLLSLAIILTFSGFSHAFDGWPQSFPEGGVLLWGSGEINVTRDIEVGEDGQPTPLAVRKAVSGARKQLLDIILTTRIDGKRTVSAYLSEDAALSARVRGMVHNSPLERPSVFAEGDQVRVFEKFRGKLAEVVLPTTIQFQSGIPPKLSTSMEQQFGYESNNIEEVGTGSSGYTGVIIDATGLAVTPALAPVIYGQDGVGAYGAFYVSRANAIKHGVVAYTTTADPGKLRSRVGNNPLIVKAINAHGSWRTDLIISTPMAKLVRATMSSPSLRGNSRVVIALKAPELPVEENPDGTAVETVGEEGLADESSAVEMPLEEQ